MFLSTEHASEHARQPMTRTRLSLLAALLATAPGCDSSDASDYAVEVLSVTETRYDERGTPGLAFEVVNVGPRSLYNLEVTVVPEPAPRPNTVVNYAAQAVEPVRSGETVVVEVPLSGRSSGDFDCYRYDIAGFDGRAVPAGEPYTAVLYERFDGTCGR